MVDQIPGAGDNVSPEPSENPAPMQQIIAEFMGLGDNAKKEKEKLIEHIEAAIEKAHVSGETGPSASNVTGAFTTTLADLNSGMKPETAYQQLSQKLSLGAGGVGLMNAFGWLRKTLVDASERLKHGEPPEKEKK